MTMDSTTVFGIIVSLVIFIIFLILGYLSMKRSGGFFLILAGFSLMSMSVSAYGILGIAAGMLILFSCIIILSGVVKAFINKTAQPETGPIRGS